MNLDEQPVLVDQLCSLTLNDSKAKTYFGKEFNLAKFKQPIVLSKYTIDDVKTSLSKITCYVGLHPPWSLYQNYHRLFYKMSRCRPDRKSSFMLMYHLAESAHHALYRYRDIIHTNRKLVARQQTPTPESFGLSTIKNDDYFYQTFSKDLPQNWRMVQLQLCSNETNFPDLLIARFQAGKNKPSFLKIQSKDQQKVSVWKFKKV